MTTPCFCGLHTPGHSPVPLEGVRISGDVAGGHAHLIYYCPKSSRDARISLPVA